MSTTTKGNKLEEDIFQLLNGELDLDRFFVKRENSKVFLKKGYYSKDRQKEIIFDLSSEVYLPGESNYSLLILIECKNYNHAVPVDDAEEFFAKVQQISGANTKGIIVSTNSFQEGTINFSKSKGIGLLRYFKQSEFKWILTRSPSTLISTRLAFKEQNTVFKGINIDSYQSNLYDCFCYIGGEYTNSLNMFFLQLVWYQASRDHKNLLAKTQNTAIGKQNLVSFIDEAEIENICNGVLEKVNYKSGEVSLIDICEWQAMETGLHVHQLDSQLIDSEGHKILGSINFDPLEINIYADTDSKATQKKFTLAHELGHLILGHSQYMIREYCQENDFDFQRLPELGPKDIVRLEWQANYFASCILLPTKVFLSDFLHSAADLNLSNRGYGILFVDDQQCNLDSFYTITNRLKVKYNVSRSVVKIRLENMGLLTDNRTKRGIQRAIGY